MLRKDSISLPSRWPSRIIVTSRPFPILFDYFAPRLKSLLMRQKMASGEAEELVQEVMVVLWQKADLYDARESSLSTWLFRIARNRRIDMQRRRQVPAISTRHDPALQPPADIGAEEMVDK